MYLSFSYLGSFGLVRVKVSVFGQLLSAQLIDVLLVKLAVLVLSFIPVAVSV